jgi:hypothetical protein
MSRRGYRFGGRAAVHRDGAVYREATRRVFAAEGAAYPVESVILIAVEHAAPPRPRARTVAGLGRKVT